MFVYLVRTCSRCILHSCCPDQCNYNWHGIYGQSSDLRLHTVVCVGGNTHLYCRRPVCRTHQLHGRNGTAMSDHRNLALGRDASLHRVRHA